MTIIVNSETGEIRNHAYCRTKFNYDRDQASLDSSLYTDPDENDGKTQQQFVEEADINTIVNNFLKTGEMPDNVKLPQYIDYEGVFDFQTAMNTMLDAEQNFMQIPAKIRAQFENDPQQFLEFAANPENKGKLHEMGFLREDYKPPEPKAPPADSAGTSTST